MTRPLLRSTAHQPTQDCWPFHCFFHGVDEDWFHDVDEEVSAGFGRCLECGHSYGTAGALRRAWRREMPPLYPRGRRFWAKLTVRVKDIGFCPFCLHDF